MSILIKGMDMPKSCFYCQFQHKNTTECLITHEYYNWGLTTPPSDCPLIELPPHGRLIDADMLTTVTEMVNGKWKTYLEVFEITDAPTIIESEGEDG